jgi:predicted ribosomally synthesized peptide with SipW-like signal peptide
MSNAKKTLIIIVAMMLACVISVAATYAYLYDRSETAVTSFSVADNA